MKVLILDYEDAYEPATWATFGGDQSVFDFDVVIWDPKEALSHYLYDSLDSGSFRDSHYQGLPSLGSHASSRLMNDLSRRRSEFKEFVEAGRCLVVIARPPQECYFDTGQRQYSGTGRNQKTTRIVNRVDLLSAIPLDLTSTPAKGSNIVYCGPDGPFQRFWQGQKSVLRYEAVITAEKVAKPLWKIAGTNKVVGAVVNHRTSGGTIVIIPAPEFDDYTDANEDEHPESEKAAHFQRSVVELAKALSDTAGAEPAPEWAQQFQLAGEAEALEEAAKADEALEVARVRRQESVERLRQAREPKQLIYGSGRELELRVREVFELLKCSVKETEPGRDDWIVEFPEGPAVVEVKGLTGSAAEKHCAQLEKWVSAYLEEHEVQPKGLLIVNGWRSLPVDERTEPVFPDQMLKYATSRDHCLVTGIQMLAIGEELKARPRNAKKIRGALLATSGIFADYADWSAALAKNKPEPSAEGDAPEAEEQLQDGAIDAKDAT